MAYETRPDSLAVLASAFYARVSSLNQLAALRTNNLSPHSKELHDLEATLDAVESDMQQIQAAITAEREQFEQAEALTEAVNRQKDHLDFISQQELPRFLPSSAVGKAAAQCSVQLALSHDDVPGKENHPAEATSTAASAAQPAVTVPAPTAAAERHERPDNAAAVVSRKVRSAAPRRYITKEELDGVSAYMRNRLTIEKINAAVDHIATLAEANAKLLGLARGSSLAVGDRERAQMLQRNVANREDVKGRYWLLEHDLKNGAVLKLDKTSKSILMILRHLGRLQEVHCQVKMDDSFETVYVMQ